MTTTPKQDRYNELRVRGGTGRLPTWLTEIADGHRSPTGSFDQIALTADWAEEHEREHGSIQLYGDRRAYTMRRRQFLDVLTAIAERDAHIERLEADRDRCKSALREAIGIAFELPDYMESSPTAKRMWQRLAELRSEFDLHDQCGQCGAVILGHHACQGVPGWVD